MNNISPIERETYRASLLFQGKLPFLPDEYMKIKWFIYGAIGTTATIVLMNLLIWRK